MELWPIILHRKAGHRQGAVRCLLLICTWSSLRRTFPQMWLSVEGCQASPAALVAKDLPANARDMRHGFGPLEENMATDSSTLAWGTPWTEEPGRLQLMGSQTVRHDWSDLAHTTQHRELSPVKEYDTMKMQKTITLDLNYDSFGGFWCHFALRKRKKYGFYFQLNTIEIISKKGEKNPTVLKSFI